MLPLEANSRTIKLLIHLVEQHATAAYDIVEMTKLFRGTPHHTTIARHGPDNDWSMHVGVSCRSIRDRINKLKREARENKPHYSSSSLKGVVKSQKRRRVANGGVGESPEGSAVARVVEEDEYGNSIEEEATDEDYYWQEGSHQ